MPTTDTHTPSAPVTGRLVHHRAGTAPSTWAMGSLFEHLLHDEDSAGRLGVALVTQPPGVASPLHRHSRESEVFFVLSGTMTYRAGDDVLHLGEGDFVHLPQGMPHAFRVTGSEPVRFLGLAAPGRLFHLYEEVGVPAAERRPPGPDGPSAAEEVPRWNAVAGRYGLEVLGPPLPEDA
ncbi:dimethylsulfonioproprionate lyase family protein [Jannaschia sp. R86511]|uniref:dimethylsulfonioproprionate lyase family protein n=1 Tax=Jannaschia sp. R86511 TaxID=3093853 RepID=UPI0036D40DD5